MISVRHPAIKLASYVILGGLCVLLGVWDVQAAFIICPVAFAVDGLISNLLAGVRGGTPPPRWLLYMVPMSAILVGRSLAAVFGF